MAGVGHGVNLGGGQSYGVERNGAAEHDRRSWWALRAPGAALSTAVCPASSYVRSSHGGDEAQRRRALVTVGDGATACKRDGEEGGSGEELTAVAVRFSAGSGKGCEGVRSSAISAAERLKTTPWSWCGASGVLRVVQEA